MKVVYITVPSFFDLEISYIREISKIVEINVILCVAPVSMKSSAFSLDQIQDAIDVFPAVNYPGMQKYSEHLDLNLWYIANNPTNSIIDCYKLARKIKKFINYYKPDIIHTTDFGKQSTILYSILNDKYPKIISLHDVVPHNSATGIKKIVSGLHWKYIMKKFTNILLFSHISDEILNKRLKNIKHTVYHSILGPYDFLNKYTISNNIYDNYILFFGRIDYYKGVDVLIESYLKSNCIQRDIKLIIAGKDTINITNGLIENSIIVLNRYIENDELSNLIRNSIFVVLPYRMATQSGVTKSAFALNKPILCTNAGNLPNEVIDDKYGKVCLADDVDSLTNGINQMISSPKDIIRYSANIANDWNTDGKYSWKNIAHEMLTNVYNKIRNL